MTPRQDPCGSCSAPDGTSCSWDCPARLELQSPPARAIPDAVTAHCLICQALETGLTIRADRVIARGLTVEASRLYWQLVLHAA